MKIIFDYNRTLFDPDAQALYPGALDLVRGLAAAHELFLISTEEGGRAQAFASLGIAAYFKKALFVKEKTEEIFAAIAGGASDVAVIGDSISREIAIGNRLGYLTIRVKQGKFAAQEPQGPDERADHEIGDLALAAAIINDRHEQ